ncbi:MAG: esterase family protein, partial [Candidatus Omnitrophica bacterium]|nr:esterase family protein [Candidatus Omnitrophota bacterium]
MKKRAWFFILTIFCLGLPAACQAEPAAQAPTLDVTLPPLEVTHPSDLAIAEAQPTQLSGESCSASGVVKRYELDSQLMNAAQYVSVYFPPCYDETLPGGYPVLYLLHGQTFDDQMWLDLGAQAVADDLISSGAARPFLMIMPYEEYYYRQPENNKFPEALIEEIIPFIDSTFNTCAERACRALGGISRGASWAVRLGLQQWELFASVGAHSLPTFKGDLEALPDWLEQIPEGSAPRLYLDIGRFDPEVKTAYRFEQVLNEKGILNEWHLND